MTLTGEPQDSAADELATLRTRVAELEAQRSGESLYRGFIEQSLDGIVLMDEHGLIVEWNRKAEELIGLPRDEVLGQSGWDILNQSLPEDRRTETHQQQLQPFVNQALKTGRWHALNRASNLVHQLPDGSRRILRQTSFLIKTQRGLWVGVVLRDITARKQAEEALRQNTAHLALAQEIAHVGSWDWDLTTNTAKWSDEMFRIFGMRRDEFDGRIEAVADRVHPEDRTRYDRTMIDSLLRGVPLSQPFEFRIILPDGVVRHLLTVNPMAFEENGQITRVIGTAQDITERKRAEEELQQARADLERRNGQLTQILDIGNSLRLNLDFDSVLQEVVQAVHRTLGFGTVALNWLERESGLTYIRAHAGLDEAGQRVLAGAAVPWKSIEQVMQERFRLGRCYFVPAGEFDWEKDFHGPMYVPSYLEQADIDLGEEAWQPDDVLIVPLELHGEQFVGAIWVDQPLDGRRPNQDMARILEIFANQAAVALENAQLYAQAQRELAERVQAEATQSRYAERLQVLFEIGQAIVSAQSSTAIAEAALNHTRSLVPFQIGSITVFDFEVESAMAMTTLAGVPASGLVGQRASLDAFGLDRIDVLKRGEIHLVDDAQEFVSLPERLQSLQQKYGLRSHISMPLMVNGLLIGSLNLGSTQPRAFTPEHIVITREVAGLLAMAIQQARLHEQLQKRARELAAINKAAQAINSTLDLESVLKLVITETQTLLEAEGASVLLRFGDELEFVAAAGPGSDKLIGARLPVTAGLAGWVMREGRPVLTDNTRSDLRFYSGVDQLTGQSTRSLMAVPLIFEGVTNGVVEVVNRHAESGRAGFNQQDLETLQSMADSASIAVANARLHQAERDQRELAETLRKIGATLVSTLDRGVVLDRILEQVSRVVPNDAVAIMLIEGGQAHPARWRGFDRFGISGLAHVALSLTGAPDLRAMLETGEVYILQNIQTEPGWIAVPEYAWVRSYVGVPVLIRGEVVGFLSAYANTPGFFNQAYAERLRALADQAAIALDNANLYNAVDRHASELEQRVLERTTELEHERQRLQAVLDSAGEGIQLLDPAGRIQYINPAMERMTGYTAAEVLGVRPHLTLSKLNPPAVTNELIHCLDLGLAWQGELINRRKDGVLYDLALTLTPVHNELGELTSFVGVYRDISRLKELDRLKDQFVTRIGHELRTPVANVKLYLDLLERGKPERRAQYMQTLNSETVRLRKMVDGFLEISELDAGAEPIRLVALDLNHLVTDLVAGQQALAGQRGLTIDVQPDPDLPRALVDRMMIDKVLTNVLTNALDYTPQGGRITVSMARRQRDDQEWVTVSVKDTGPGIASEEVAHVFERFYRGKASGNFTVPGAGLGLSICKIILDKLGGQITVESQSAAEGHGATFTIWLRMAEAAGEVA